MTDDEGAGRRSFGARLARIPHPWLVGTTVLGLVLIGVAALFYSTAPVLGFRVGFLGALVALFGVTGYIAFWVHDFGNRNRGRA